MASELCEKISTLCLAAAGVMAATGGGAVLVATGSALAIPALWRAWNNWTDCADRRAIIDAAKQAEKAWKTGFQQNPEYGAVKFEHVQAACASVVDLIAIDAASVKEAGFDQSKIPQMIVDAAAAQSEEFRAPHEHYAANRVALALLAQKTLEALQSRDLFNATVMRAFQAGVMGSLERVEAKQDQHTEMLQELLRLAKGEGLAKGVPEATILALAQRIAPAVSSIEQALGELHTAIDILLRVRAEAARGSNFGLEVDEVFRRLAALNDKGDLDGGAALMARELAVLDEAESELNARRMALLGAGIDQDYLRRDAVGIAQKLVRQTSLNLGLTPGISLFDALRTVWMEWYERGRDKGLNLDLEVAIDLAKASLDVAADGDQRGTALNQFGAALWMLGQRESGTERLEEAVAAQRAALEERTRDRVPLDWAAAQNNLGAALYTLGERESGSERLEEAVKAYREALEERTRTKVPLDWAMTQNNLGMALWMLWQRESGSERLEEAVTAYRAALEERTRTKVPLDWAMTQDNLGAALCSLGERESGTERLEEAVTAYRAALEEYTRTKVPLDWAATQNNLGNALATLGERESGTERLEEAVAAYRAALKERTRDRVPLSWAATQNNLGAALYTLGERESGSKRLEQAVKTYRAALEEYTRSQVPLQWAMTQNNLGNALQMLGERESGTERLEEAVKAYRAALEEYTRTKIPLDWAMTQNNLGAALRALGERESGTERLEEAVTAYRAALKEFTRSQVPLQWASTQNNLGNALLTLGERESGTARLEEAVAAYREALKEYTRTKVPLDWAGTSYILGYAEALIGERSNNIVLVTEGIARIEAAIPVLDDGGHMVWADGARQRLEAAMAIKQQFEKPN